MLVIGAGVYVWNGCKEETGNESR